MVSLGWKEVERPGDSSSILIFGALFLLVPNGWAYVTRAILPGWEEYYDSTHKAKDSIFSHQ